MYTEPSVLGSTPDEIFSDDAVIYQLENAPTGEPMTARDHALLVLLGIVVPTLLLIWGLS